MRLADFGLALSCGAISFALAAVFIRFAMRRVQAFDSLAENAYGIYLVHYVFVIWLQYMMLSFALPAIVKGVSVFAGRHLRLGLKQPPAFPIAVIALRRFGGGREALGILAGIKLRPGLR